MLMVVFPVYRRVIKVELSLVFVVKSVVEFAKSFCVKLEVSYCEVAEWMNSADDLALKSCEPGEDF